MRIQFENERLIGLLIGGNPTLYDLHKVVCRALPDNHRERYLFSFYRDESGTQLLIDPGKSGTAFQSVVQGDRFMFGVRLHPVQRQGSRERVVPPAERENWAIRKLFANGFDIEEIVTSDFEWEPFGKKKMKVASLWIYAKGRIREIDLAQKALEFGIGRMRAFGFGMIVPNLTDLENGEIA